MVITDHEYAMACTEILVILRNMSKEDYNKIPKQLIEHFESQRDKNYRFKLNLDMPFSKQYISETTKGLLAAIYRDYWASPDEKQDILLKDREERRKYKALRTTKSNKNNIFDFIKNKKSRHIVSADDKVLMKYKEHWYVKFIKYLINIFGKNN